MSDTPRGTSNHTGTQHPLDQIIIGFGFLLLVAIGIRCSRRSQTDEGYVLAGQSMPGWVVGFSLMASSLAP